MDAFTASGQAWAIQPAPTPEKPTRKPTKRVQARKTDMRASVPSAPEKPPRPTLASVLINPHKSYGMHWLQCILVDLHRGDLSVEAYRLANREKVRKWAYLPQKDAIRMIQELAG